MKVLAMETSTLLGGVAVVIDGQVVAEESSLRQKTHSENISPFVDHCLKKAHLKLEDIDVFAVGRGPGSFTGIRVAANAGKTFAYSFNKPMVTIDTLMLLAAQVKDKSKPALSIINAYKNMVYMGLFDITGAEPIYIKGPDAVPVRELKNHIHSDCLVVGDGWEAYSEYFPEELMKKFSRDPQLPDHALASTLGLMAERRALSGRTLDWKSFVPLYIRASEAEETKKGILISPLK
ncbi:tRNA threonylcarbamoyladenosine biosynthesis protein TsaB [Bdellovibrio bacteriovorus]|uniref:tRNA threonylcarbamoyladenosine biosynthesis protein TsaB n=1 Tax=Bdellovibrio bacteriovorus TaxID=959 RepID=A0A162GSP8_BDEBC|nr:tRNA (adenosine(37)-N6)-threonylcarbamoyltransferase complex dimerization subunit type 1 TsaB [Bdellovibrio bacteriovorus]KYG68869.1 tRNA threonylcarbamoyladenosine biosynthesis protein TsaB [Bdellovibrio bacteriovorus]